MPGTEYLKASKSPQLSVRLLIPWEDAMVNADLSSLLIEKETKAQGRAGTCQSSTKRLC